VWAKPLYIYRKGVAPPALEPNLKWLGTREGGSRVLRQLPKLKDELRLSKKTREKPIADFQDLDMLIKYL
jgi:hypothetical protein